MNKKLIVFLLLAGCAGSPVRIGMMDDDDLMRVETEKLCFAYVEFKKWDAKIELELERRNVFSTREWQAIDDHKIFIGMSEQALQCSWPGPNVVDLDSAYVEREGPWGIRGVYEYGLGFLGGLPDGANVIPGAWPKKVYVENGVVVAFQEAAAVGVSDCLSFRQRRCFEFDGIISTTVSDAILY